MRYPLLWAIMPVSMTLTSCSISESPSVHDATAITQEYIRSTYDPDCEFDPLTAWGEQTSPAHYTVRQQFYTSTSGRYEYKAVAIYLGGDKQDQSNWVITDVSILKPPVNKFWND